MVLMLPIFLCEVEAKEPSPCLHFYYPVYWFC